MTIVFPYTLDMTNPNVFFKIFSVGAWANTEDLVLISNIAKDMSIEELLNNKELIKEIAKNTFGLKVEYVGDTPSVTMILSSSESSVKMADRIGFYQKNFFSQDGLVEYAKKHYILLTDSEIKVDNIGVFLTSSYINGIYNTIAIFILILAKRDKMIPSLFV